MRRRRKPRLPSLASLSGRVSHLEREVLDVKRVLIEMGDRIYDMVMEKIRERRDPPK